MSVWPVYAEEITIVVTALSLYRCLPKEHTKQTIGQMLWDENYRSTHEGAVRPQTDTAYRYTHPRNTKNVRQLIVEQPVAAYKQVEFYRYQSCGCGDWHETEACAVTKRLLRRMEAAMGPESGQIHNTPAWKHAPWGTAPRKVYAVPILR